MNLSYSRRTCPVCGIRISSDARFCVAHWQTGLNPHRRELTRQRISDAMKGNKNRSGKGGFDNGVSTWGNEVRAAVHANLEAYGLMRKCRRCRHTAECGQPAVPGAVLRLCPAIAEERPEVYREFMQGVTA
jgi:hypothetical protein